MPKVLPASVILEKNKVESQNVWMLLAKITIGSDIVYITNNNDDVVFGGNTYVKFPFNVSSMDNNSNGQVPSLTLNVSNVTKGLMAFVEASNGLVNSTVKIMVVNSGYLAEDYTELTLDYTIMQTSVTEEWISFTLGAPNPLMQRFPKDRYVAKYCNWTFNSPAVRASGTNAGAECAYLGADTTCERTQDACEAKSNTIHFGGYPGLSENGLRVIR